VLLPLSLANVLVTGVVILALQAGGADVSDALDVAADVTQAIVALAMTYGLIRLIANFLKPRTHKVSLAGSGAKLAAAAGGTPVTPMQA
jgi:NADH-quinone oxidoreductase subunit H